MNADGQKYQIVGDNWDKNIIPSYRTTEHKTISLHLFHVIAVVDRFIPSISSESTEDLDKVLAPCDFIPSVKEQELLKKELTFICSTALVQNLDPIAKHFEKIYPTHLEHCQSNLAGQKTKQFPLGLFDCHETKTQAIIQILQDLSDKYVPLEADGNIKDEVFFGGDRLTDERIQGAQQAMANADTPKERLEGFISKIEDWHRMMNFMEAIHKMTYAESGSDRGTASYFRNFLNARDVKGKVKNSFRAYKLLYYRIFDAMCCTLFLSELGIETPDDITFPTTFDQMSTDDKINWLDELSRKVITKWFFEDKNDVFEQLRTVLEDPNHDENYWVSNEHDGRFPCHFCDKSYANIGSAKTHEKMQHGHIVPTNKSVKKKSEQK